MDSEMGLAGRGAAKWIAVPWVVMRCLKNKWASSPSKVPIWCSGGGGLQGILASSKSRKMAISQSLSFDGI